MRCEKGRGFKKVEEQSSAVQVWMGMDGQKRRKGLAAERPEAFQSEKHQEAEHEWDRRTASSSRGKTTVWNRVLLQQPGFTALGLAPAYEAHFWRIIVRARREATMGCKTCGEGTRVWSRE